MQGDWKSIVRDVFIVMLLTAFGGLVIGLSGSTGERALAAIGISNFIFGTVGFCISGCLVKIRRFRHLIVVALMVWLASFINVFVGVPLEWWLMAIIPMFSMMLLGGAISLTLVRASQIPIAERELAQKEKYLASKEWCLSLVGSIIAGLITTGITSVAFG